MSSSLYKHRFFLRYGTRDQVLDSLKSSEITMNIGKVKLMTPSEIKMGLENKALSYDDLIDLHHNHHDERVRGYAADEFSQRKFEEKE